jgi:hypothetical protein
MLGVYYYFRQPLRWGKEMQQLRTEADQQVQGGD